MKNIDFHDPMPLPPGTCAGKKHYPTLQGACTLLQGTCAPAAGSYAPATGNMTPVHAPAARNVDRIDIPATGVYAPAAGVGMPLPQGIREIKNTVSHGFMPLLQGIGSIRQWEWLYPLVGIGVPAVWNRYIGYLV